MIKELYGVRIESANAEDGEKLAAELVPNMRREDFEESILFNIPPTINVKLSVKRSEIVYAARADGELLGVFGLSRYRDPVIWFLGTEAVKKHRKALVTIGYSFIEDMVREYRYVVNYISLANRPAIRYIKGVRAIGLVCEAQEDSIGMHFKIRREICAESQG